MPQPNSITYSYTQEDIAWLFSFDHQTKLKVKPGGGNAIAHGKNNYPLLPTFGGGWDLSAYENGH